MNIYLNANGSYNLSVIMSRAMNRARREVDAHNRLVARGLLDGKANWRKILSDVLKSLWNEVKQVTAYARQEMGYAVEMVTITEEQRKAMSR